MAVKHLARVALSLAAAYLRNSGGAALADDAGQEKAKAVAEAPPAAGETPSPSLLNSLPSLAYAAALKKQLKDQGFTIQSTYIGETLGIPSGGMRQGAIYEGRLETTLDVDLEKLAHLPGLTFHADGFWIQGTGLARYYLGNLMPEDELYRGAADGSPLRTLARAETGRWQARAARRPARRRFRFHDQQIRFALRQFDHGLARHLRRRHAKRRTRLSLVLHGLSRPL